MTDPDDNSLADCEVLLCVTGGIAAYKAAELASRLVQGRARVTVAMTEAATRFVAPLTFQTLTGRPVHISLWEASDDYRSGHISLTERAEVMIVAPATANILGKMAAGIADDLVSTMALAATGACPILVAPAMNERMWASHAVQANVRTLRNRGIRLIGPEEGYLACGTTGPGRMSEPAEILAAAREMLKNNKGSTG